MRILMVATEVSPLVAVGELGDSVGALAVALKKRGHDVRVVLPAYGCIAAKGKGLERPMSVKVGFEERWCKVWETTLNGSDVPAYLIEYNLFFGRQEIYNSAWGACQDNDHRFVFFTRAAVELCDYLNWQPEVFHCHDWMTALLPVYLNTIDRKKPIGKTASVLTIHDLQFQGTFHSGLIEWAGLDRAEVFRSDNLESMEGVNLLKGGIYNATKIATVSPSYAREIQSRMGGCGLESVINFRSDDLAGILDGVDARRWDPATDGTIARRFGAESLDDKAACKAELQKAFGLAEDASAPLFGLVGRLTHQRGADLVGAIVPRLVTQTRAQLVVFGTGDESLQWGLSAHATKYPGRVAVNIGTDEKRLRQVFAGADAIVCPCRFAPRGITARIAMRYGTLPVARATGGLADSVEPWQEATGKGSGFLFELPHPDALYAAMETACRVWSEKPEAWKGLMSQAMTKSFSWDDTAQKYEALYAQAAEKRAAKV